VKPISRRQALLWGTPTAHYRLIFWAEEEKNKGNYTIAQVRMAIKQVLKKRRR
jgi:hypothetical protein